VRPKPVGPAFGGGTFQLPVRLDQRDDHAGVAAARESRDRTHRAINRKMIRSGGNDTLLALDLRIIDLPQEPQRDMVFGSGEPTNVCQCRAREFFQLHPALLGQE
jgi:hypothetical protein